MPFRSERTPALVRDAASVTDVSGPPFLNTIFTGCYGNSESGNRSQTREGYHATELCVYLCSASGDRCQAIHVRLGLGLELRESTLTERD